MGLMYSREDRGGGGLEGGAERGKYNIQRNNIRLLVIFNGDFPSAGITLGVPMVYQCAEITSLFLFSSPRTTALRGSTDGVVCICLNRQCLL